MSDLQLPMTTKPKTYGMLVGTVAALLAVGLIVPVAVGSRTSKQGAGTQTELDLTKVGGGGSGEQAFDASGNPITDPDVVGPDGSIPGGGPSDTPGASLPGGALLPNTPGATTPGATTPGNTGTTPANVKLTASDVGVTPTSIRIGLLVPTSSSIGSTADQSKIQVAEFEAFTKEINAKGGIYGRKIETVVANYDILNQDEGARAACLKLVDDLKVFAVFNTTGFGPPGALCVTKEKGVPFLQGSGHPDEVYGQSKGLYSSTFDSQTRGYRNVTWFTDQLGVMKGKKVGVLGTEWIGLRPEIEEGIVDTLKALGYDPYVYWLSGDPVSSQSQIPVAIQQFRSAGVQVLFLVPDFVSGQSFVSQADGQAFRPLYVSGDPWGYSTDYIPKDYPAASWNGAITVTSQRFYDDRVGLKEPVLDGKCRETFERSSGIKADRANDPNAIYVGAMYACGVVKRFEAVATAVGPNLTRAGFAKAVPSLGTIDVPFAGGPATYGPRTNYGPNKLDGANNYRPQRWDGGCDCWKPVVVNFTKGKY